MCQSVAARGRGEDRGEGGRLGGAGEGTAEPFAVGRVAAVHEQAEPHQIAHQALNAYISYAAVNPRVALQTTRQITEALIG